MTDLQHFEVRLSRALGAYADGVDARIDPWDVAVHVSERPRRPWDRLRPAVPMGLPRLAPVIVLALVLALVAGLVWVGSSLLLQSRRLPALVPSAIELVAVDASGPRSAAAATDGAVWMAQSGRIDRIDPIAGTTQSWDLGDDLAFDAAVARARGGGVWLVQPSGIQRFDGVALGERIEGPPGVSIASVAEGSDGRLWITASEPGLFRRDGAAWTRVPLPLDNVTAGALAVDDHGRPWISSLVYPGPSVLGVSRFDGSAWTTYSTRDTAALTDPVGSIAIAPDGAVWFGTSAGVAVLRDGTWTSFGKEVLWADAGVNLTIAPDGTVWAGSQFGPTRVAAYDGETWRVYGPANGLPAGTDEDTIVVPTDLGVFAARYGDFERTERQLLRLSGERWTPIAGLDARPVAPAYLKLIGGAGADAWGLASPEEAWHAEGSALSRESVTVGGRPTVIRDLVRGPDGTMWAATAMGVASLTGRGWEVIDPTPASVVAVGPDGRAWAADGKRVWVLARQVGGWASVRIADAPIGGMGIGRMIVDSRGDLWAAGGRRWFPAGGLYRFDGVAWERIDPDPRADFVTGGMAVAPNGDLWVTLDGPTRGCCILHPPKLVARFDGRTWTTYGSADGIDAGGSTELDLAITPDGTVWLAVGGLHSFDGVAWTRQLIGRADAAIQSIAVSADGSLWAAGWSGVLHITLGTLSQGQGR